MSILIKSITFLLLSHATLSFQIAKSSKEAKIVVKSHADVEFKRVVDECDKSKNNLNRRSFIISSALLSTAPLSVKNAIAEEETPIAKFALRRAGAV